MEETTIEYFINNDPIFVKKDKKGKFSTAFYEYTVSNNIELPNKIEISSALMKDFGNFGSKALTYAKSIEWTWDYNKNQFYGSEPQELKNLIFENQKKIILKKFYEKGPYNKIPGKSYKNQNYPIGGTLKSLYNQDPIVYTFSSITVDKTSQELLSGVKIKDLEGQSTTSNPDGSFDITGTFSPGKVQKLTFNLKKYGVKTQIITTLNGSIRSDINVIELTTDKEIKSTILKSRGTTKEEKKKLTKEEKADFVKETAKKIIEEIKIRLIPFLIKKLLCEPYGVCDPIGLIEKAKEAKEKAKDLNEKIKEKKAKKEAEKELAEEAEQNSIDEEN